MRYLLLAAGLVLAGCGLGETETLPDISAEGECQIPSNQIFDGGPGKDGIPALTNPALVSAAEATYLQGSDRVVGIVRDGQAVAIPHNVLWWHEIANVDLSAYGLGSEQLAVSYCPLTGSTIAFDRSAVGGAEFGVSGLLFQTNLIMYDRRDSESLWPQMSRQAECGTATGTALPMESIIEMTWDGWQTLYPETRVVSTNTGFSRDYTDYPYGDYERLTNTSTLFPVPSIDDRRPPKERVLGIPTRDGGIAFPFGTLAEGRLTNAVSFSYDDEPAVVLWSTEAEGAMAYRRTVNGQRLTFTPDAGRILDSETGSAWTVDGRAVSGPLAGTQLDPIDEAYVAFWFAWAIFEPDTALWEG